MAKRRMFSLDIIDTDSFLDMPASTQNLYFHLGMRADDDGFVASPRKITSCVNCSPDDYKLLVAKGYVIHFESGICAIRDWQINNHIRSDRYTPTIHTAEKKQLSSGMTLGIPNVIPVVSTGKYSIGEVSIGKDSSGEDSSVKDSKEKERARKTRFVPPSLDEVKIYCKERKSCVDPYRFWEYFDSGGWTDSKGQKVRNWKQKLITWENHSSNTGGKRNDSRSDHKNGVSEWDNIVYTCDWSKL